MPDYDSMLSPALRGELRRFGLKAIPRRKAVQILSHIYEQTHPVVEKVSRGREKAGIDWRLRKKYAKDCQKSRQFSALFS